MTDADLGPGVPPVLKNYRLVRRLGAGGMGAVYEAVDRRDDTRLAIKLLHPHLAGDENFRERFEREAHVAALLRSPYTVHLLDYGFAEGYFFLAMEFIEGETVAALINREGRVDPKRALGIAADAARALEEAEARGVVHRDIKPDNILLGAHGSVKVADFGIARRTGGGGDLAGSEGFIGTTTYASPEQAAGGEVDHRADIYALGATLYCMLAGQPPFSASTSEEVLRQHREATLPMAPLAGFPDAVVNIVRRCMEKDPADRYESATQLVGALERAQRGLSSAPPLPAATIAPSPAPVSSGRGDVTLAGVPGPAVPAAAASLETVVGGGDSGGTPPRPAKAPGGGGNKKRSVILGAAGLGALAVFGAAAIFAMGGGDDEPSSTDREATLEARTSTAEARETRAARTANAGGDDDTRTPAPTAGSTKTAGASSSVAPTSAATATRTPTSPAPTATATRTPTTAAGTGGYIIAGDWTYDFFVVSNTCGSGPEIGDYFEVVLTLEDANGDGFLDSGETVTIYDTGQSGNEIGDFTFTYPRFSFQADLEGGEFVVFSNVYDSPSSGSALREDHYTVNARPCVIVFED